MISLFSGKKVAEQSAQAGNGIDVIISTVEQVKLASTEVVDGVTIVRNLADENKHSANGMAFVTTDSRFEAAEKKMITVNIPELPIESARTINACIMRCKPANGEYIIGCRLPGENMDIKEYINKAG